MNELDKPRIWGGFEFFLDKPEFQNKKKLKYVLFSQKRYTFTSQKKNMRLILLQINLIFFFSSIWGFNSVNMRSVSQKKKGIWGFKGLLCSSRTSSGLSSSASGGAAIATRFWVVIIIRHPSLFNTIWMVSSTSTKLFMLPWLFKFYVEN